MTQDELIKCGCWFTDTGALVTDDIDLNAFAKLVADKERDEWRNAAIRVGENLATCGPAGYYDYTSQQWLDWALDATTKMQDDYMNLGACGEREACAKLADYLPVTTDGYLLPESYAEAIRARRQA